MKTRYLAASLLLTAFTSPALAAAARQPDFLNYLPVIAGVVGVAVLGVAIFGPMLASREQKTKYSQGKDYLRLKHPQPTSTGEKIEVAEVFSYSDPESYRLEPVVSRWERGKQENAQLVRVPYVLKPEDVVFAKAFYAARTLGVLELVHGALFDAIHISGRDLSDEKKMAEFFAEFGVAEQDFKRVFNSSVTLTEVKKADLLNKGYGMSKAPALIVNGTYMCNEQMAGSSPKLVEILDHILERETKVA